MERIDGASSSFYPDQLYSSVNRSFLHFQKGDLESRGIDLLYDQGEFFSSLIRLMNFYLKSNTSYYPVGDLLDKAIDVSDRLTKLYLDKQVWPWEVWFVQRGLQLQNGLYGSFVAMQAFELLKKNGEPQIAKEPSLMENEERFLNAVGSLREEIIQKLSITNLKEKKETIKASLRSLMHQALNYKREAYQILQGKLSEGTPYEKLRDLNLYKKSLEALCKDPDFLEEERLAKEFLLQEAALHYFHLVFIILSNWKETIEKSSDPKIIDRLCQKSKNLFSQSREMERELSKSSILLDLNLGETQIPGLQYCSQKRHKQITLLASEGFLSEEKRQSIQNLEKKIEKSLVKVNQSLEGMNK
jgi:hypothetical protein